MIGMMNGGSEPPVEFYSANRRSSLYIQTMSKDYRSYTPEGRVLINGQPQNDEKAEDLWKDLIIRAVTRKVIKENVQKEHGPMAAIRRLSNKLGLSPRSSLSPPPRSPPSSNNHVTLIRLATFDADKRVKLSAQESIYPIDGEGILNILMEENRMKKREEEEMDGEDEEYEDGEKHANHYASSSSI